MDKPFDARPARKARQLFGRFHMQRLKCLCSALEIEADGMHHAVVSGDGSFNRVFVLNIGAYRLKP